MSKRDILGLERHRERKHKLALFFKLLVVFGLAGIVGGWLYIRGDLPVGLPVFLKFLMAAIPGLPWDSNTYPDTYARAVFWYGPAISMGAFSTLWSILLIAEWRRAKRLQEGV